MAPIYFRAWDGDKIMLRELYENKKTVIDAHTYESYNDFAAAKVEEMSDMVIALLQYEDANYALQIAQYAWINEYYKKRKLTCT
tara:strand:+ start:347 stop:598 length:252 start_codon:yes stop_codon:yes gene_type:complete